MADRSDYREIVTGEWRLLALPGQWNSHVQSQVLNLIRAQRVERHPQTVEVRCQIGDEEKTCFLKVFHRMTLAAAAKDLLGRSKAFDFWRQGLALSAAGFKVPLTIAVGKARGWRIAKPEFVLTEKIDGAPLPLFLRRQLIGGALALGIKRDHIKKLAQLIRSFHDAGFVHGDLVATNIFVAARPTGGGEFVFMDNDRTRRYPSWLPQPLWKRNLTQLSRLPLPGISLQDRLRFLRSYLNVSRFAAADRRFAAWLEAKTRQRRQECDGVDPTGSFRKLMRWDPEMAGVKVNIVKAKKLNRSEDRADA